MHNDYDNFGTLGLPYARAHTHAHSHAYRYRVILQRGGRKTRGGERKEEEREGRREREKGRGGERMMGALTLAK